MSVKRSHKRKSLVSQEELDLNHQLFDNDLYNPPLKKSKTNKNNTTNDDTNDDAVWHDPEDDTDSDNDNEESVNKSENEINIQKNRKLRHLRKSFNEEQISKHDYIQRQRKNLQSAMDPNEDWTKPLPNTGNDSDSNEQHGNNKALGKILTESASDILNYTDLRSVNSRNSHESCITVCEFSNKFVMTAGLDKTICLFSLNDSFSLIKKIFLSDLPIRCGHFSENGSEIIVSGRRKYFYSISLIDNFELRRIDRIIGCDDVRSLEHFVIGGQYIVFIASGGSMIVCSLKSKKMIKKLQIPQSIVVSMKLCKTNGFLYVLAKTGSVYVFDMNNKKFRCVNVINSFANGIVRANCFDINYECNMIVIGCNSGVVNVHDLGNEHKMLFSVDNVLTPSNGVHFNFDSKYLVLHSKNEKNAIRLVNMQNGRVYRNWPKTSQSVSFVCKSNFSNTSSFLAIANDLGLLRMIRLHEYHNN